MAPPVRRALLVDASPPFRRRIRDILHANGWTVDEAEGVLEAEALVGRREYEAIVVDFLLPDGDGVQCIRTWRSLGVTSPVLALTGAEGDAVIRAFIHAGAHDVLEKRRFSEAAFLAALEATGGPPDYPEAELPRATPFAPALHEGEVADHVQMDGRRALVVDDTLLFRILLRRILEQDGWRVEEAVTAEEALTRAGEGYDLLLVDYLLPDMDGAALLHTLRTRGVETPALALTAHGSNDVARDLLTAGARACVPKHLLNEDRLRHAVKETLGGVLSPGPRRREGLAG